MQPTYFINVDLDLRSESDLKELVESFGSAVIVMAPESVGYVSLEIAEDVPQNCEAVILAFYELIISLPSKARAIWDACETRCMDIGIQAGLSPYSENFRLSERAISCLSSINAEVAITVYAPPSELSG